MAGPLECAETASDAVDLCHVSCEEKVNQLRTSLFADITAL